MRDRFSIAGGGHLSGAQLQDKTAASQAALTAPGSIALANDGTVFFIDNNLEAFELKEQNDGSGVMSGSSTAEGIDLAVKNSLSLICQGFLRSIIVKDTCPASDGETRIAISQSFDAYANIMEMVKPCLP